MVFNSAFKGRNNTCEICIEVKAPINSVINKLLTVSDCDGS